MNYVTAQNKAVMINLLVNSLHSISKIELTVVQK